MVTTPKIDAGAARRGDTAAPPARARSTTYRNTLAKNVIRCYSPPSTAATWHPPRCNGPGTTRRATSQDRPDLRFHDLRHSGAVLAAATGATLAELMGRLGHSTPAAAMRYQHAAQGRDKQIAALLSKLPTSDTPK